MPELQQFSSIIPNVTSPTFQTLIMQHRPAPGFLGLDLSELVAIDVLTDLIAAGATGMRLLSAYREAPMTFDQATVIAEKAIATQQRHSSPYTFAPLRSFSNGPVCWTCEIVSEQPRFVVYVDKIDSHLWSEQDLKHLYNEMNLIKLRLLQKKAQEEQFPIIHWQEHFQTYDLHLSRGCQTLPVFNDFVGQIPALSDPVFQQKLLQRVYAPGFLHLDLPHNLAVSLLQRLKTTGASGSRLPAAYRVPRITMEQAKMIAEPAIYELKQQYDPEGVLDPIKQDGGSEISWWVRSMTSRLWREGQEGASLGVQVDRVDGHIWTEDELALYHHENACF